MRQQRRAGEKLFIDYAGPILALADGTRAQVFVAAMGASSYTFACATADQRMRSSLVAIARALAFYGGVPQLIVPDNPRALVSQACRYEPRVNDTVHDFARHYGVSILPARPYSPKDKVSTESAVQVVERRLMARLRHTEKLVGVASAVEEQLSSSASTGLSFEDRLALLVDREVHHRDDKRRAALTKRAGAEVPAGVHRRRRQRTWPGVRAQRADESGAVVLDREWRSDLGQRRHRLGQVVAACALAQCACRRGHSALSCPRRSHLVLGCTIRQQSRLNIGLVWVGTTLKSYCLAREPSTMRAPRCS